MEDFVRSAVDHPASWDEGLADISIVKPAHDKHEYDDIRAEVLQAEFWRMRDIGPTAEQGHAEHFYKHRILWRPNPIELEEEIA